MAVLTDLLQQSSSHSISHPVTSDSVLHDFAADDVEQRDSTREMSECTYQNERFTTDKIKLAPQFASLYFVRLVQIRQMILENFNEREIDERKVKLCNSLLEVEDGIDCIIFGTIYKNMTLKPSVIDEYTSENAVAKETIASKSGLSGRFVSDDDNVELEDEYARLKLLGNLNIHQLVTGIVIGVQGHLMPSGEFFVEQTFLPALTASPRPSLTADKYVLLISGLHCGNNSILTHLMADHITGLINDGQSNDLLKLVSRMIICGNAIQTRNELPEDQELAVRPRRIGSVTASQTLPALRALDVLLERLCNSIDVDLIPGFMDPTNVALPQQPFNPLFLPRSSRLSSLNLLSNPASLCVEGVSLYGTSGQNVDDIMDYSNTMSVMDVIEATYRWRISCPTCPDTLHCLPFNDRDPFVLSELPHVYFAGNQSQFDTRLIKTAEGQPVRLIAVPCFAQTGQIVLLNLRSLDCELVQYSA